MEFIDLNLSKPLLKALADLEYTTATTIQEKACPAVMSGKDLVGIAQTGTGKTLAYLLPSLKQWKFSKEPHPQIVVLVPTRELVMQVVRETEKLSTYINLVVQGVYGGANINTQHDRVSQGVDVLVATPGRLRDLYLKGSVRFKNVKKLIIDEVDEMLNLGFRHQLVKLFDFFPERRQNLMFSATITEEVEALINDYFMTPLRVEAAPTGTPLKNITQIGYSVPNFNSKINVLETLLADRSEYNKVLVFAATRKMAELLFARAEQLFPEEVGIIHSNKSQNNRFATVDRFHKGECRVLIATDLIARGIDVHEVSHVVNFDMPEVPEVYIHRIGRTGRADKKGNSISLITEKDSDSVVAIEKLMDMSVPMKDLPEGVELSTELIEAEMDVVLTPNIELKTPRISGNAFEEKKTFEQKKKKRKPKNPVKGFKRQPKHNKGRSKSKRR